MTEEFQQMSPEKSDIFTGRSSYGILIKIKQKKKEKLNMNGQIVHNKINMHLENRENFHFMPTLNVSVFLTQS